MLRAAQTAVKSDARSNVARSSGVAGLLGRGESGAIDRWLATAWSLGVRLCERHPIGLAQRARPSVRACVLAGQDWLTNRGRPSGTALPRARLCDSLACSLARSVPEWGRAFPLRSAPLGPVLCTICAVLAQAGRAQASQHTTTIARLARRRAPFCVCANFGSAQAAARPSSGAVGRVCDLALSQRFCTASAARRESDQPDADLSRIRARTLALCAGLLELTVCSAAFARRQRVSQ